MEQRAHIGKHRHRQSLAVALLLMAAYPLAVASGQDVRVRMDSSTAVPERLAPSLARVQALDNRSPRGALWRAAAVPGWGQLYNRQYLKMPFVYAGLGGIVALALRMNGRYLLFRHAYQHKADDEGLYAEGETPPPDAYATDYAQVLVLLNAVGSDVPASTLEQYRDNYRRNRDLSYIGIGLVYSLTVIDAFVAAHLLDFDVGEDLTVSVRPGPEGVAAALRLGF